MIRRFVTSVIILFSLAGCFGVFLIASAVKEDKKMVFNSKTTIDLNYVAKLSNASQLVALIWTIVSVLLIFLTFNVQRKQTAENSIFLIRQQFETTFFNMLNVLFNIKTAIHSQKDGTALVGQEFMDFAIKELKKYHLAHSGSEYIPSFINKIRNLEPITQTELAAIASDLDIVYISFYSDYHAELGHYFRYLYNLLKFTISHREKYKDQKNYLDIIQAQLSNAELGLVFYNAISNKGLNTDKKYRFYNWLEQYSFLENIDEKSLITREHNVLYPKTLFKFLNNSERQMRNEIPIFIPVNRMPDAT